MEDIIILIGRILFGLVFLLSGIGHLRARAAMTAYAQAKGVPAAGAMVVITGIMLILGSLSIILGIFPEIGALLLIIFLLPTTFMMHAFWKETDPMMKMSEQSSFFKGLALLGGALMIFAWAAGMHQMADERALFVVSNDSVIMLEN